MELTCGAQRYAKGDCDGPPKFEVFYRNTHGAVLDRHPACFKHGLAEVDRHHASGGISRCDLVQIMEA